MAAEGVQVEFSPATADDLAEVEGAAAAFRALWASLRAMPFPAPFDGGVGDIRALDYLDYEGLAYPPGGVAAALVWGRVLARQCDLSWARCGVGGLWLRTDEAGGRLAVWPLARVAEAQARYLPQSGKYAALTGRVLAECLEAYDGVRRGGSAVGAATVGVGRRVKARRTRRRTGPQGPSR